MAAAFSGVRGLELCQGVAGAYCAKLLADLGAEVVKLEDPCGDEARRRGPFLGDVPHPEASGLFLYLNTNKLGITLNLNTGLGRELLRRLVAESDVLVEDNPPGRLRRWGLDYPRLSRLNPRLVMTSITPFGQSGPHARYKAHHLNLYHAGGDGYLLAPGRDMLDRPPVKGGGWVGETMSGLGAAIATVAAIYWQRLTGQGQHLDLSQQEWLLGLNRMYLDLYPAKGVVLGRESIRLRPQVRCRDGYAIVYFAEPHHWERLKAVMGNSAWAEDERFSTPYLRAQHQEELVERISQWLSAYTKAEVQRMMTEAGVPVGMVATAEEVVGWRQMAARGFFQEIDHPYAGRLKYPTAPYRFSRTPWQAVRPAPRLGEHNQEVLGNWLGISGEELVRLRGTGVV